MQSIEKLFNDLERPNIMQDDLYVRKYRIGFSQILVRMPDNLFEAIHGDVNKQFEWGLKYVYPLIEEGKLKARIAKKVECEIMPDGVPRYTTVLWGEYGKGEGKEFIQDAERYYKKCENSKERMNFSESSILLILPENEWGEY